MPAIAELPTVAPAVRRRPRFHLTWRRAIVLVLVIGLLVVAAEAGRVLIGGNFHTVLPGQVYRGAQPTPATIESLVNDYHIKTIVNLRGCGNPNGWYVAQSRMAQHLDVAQEDVCLSAVRLPAFTEIRRLVEVLDRVEYPIYLHCWRGADRTGLASVMVLLLKTDASLAEARRQLSMRYGHMSVGKAGHLDEFFALYEEWLREKKLDHSRTTFRRWALEEYQGEASYQIESWERTSGPPRQGEPLVYKLRVRNTSRETWHFHPHPVAGMHLGYRITDDKEGEVLNGRGALFEATVLPGQTIDLTMATRPIHEQGRYRIVIDMMKGYYLWFHQTGAEPLEEELDVRE
jgi:protein tyrosine/serine phosphatase